MSDSKVTAVMAVSVIAVCVYHNSCCFDAEAFATMAIMVVTTVASALAAVVVATVAVVVATVAVVVVAVAAAAATTILNLSAVIQIAGMAPFATAAVTTAVDAQ